MTAPTPERRVGEAAVPLTMSEEGQNAARILMEAHPMVIPLFEGVVAELDKAEAEVTRLTAEVERLRGIAQQAIWMLNEWDESMSSYQQGTSDGATAKELAARLAALSLPTPAPEATE